MALIRISMRGVYAPGEMPRFLSVESFFGSIICRYMAFLFRAAVLFFLTARAQIKRR